VHDGVLEIQPDLLVGCLSHQDPDNSLLRIDEEMRPKRAAPPERSRGHE
jgi:hypothetical protein